MTTANVITSAALKLLNVASSISPATPEQQEEAFIALQDMIAGWEACDVDLGIYVPTSADEELDEPEWATRCLKLLLAEEIAPYFQVEPSETLKSRIQEAADSLQIHGVTTSNPVMQSTLPKGAGNRTAPHARIYFSENTST